MTHQLPSLRPHLPARSGFAAVQVYHHVTCATDTKNIETVFNACKEIILRENITGSGFME